MNGVAHITVHAQDVAGASIDDSFTVTVDSVNDTPVAVDDSATMNEDAGTLSIDVLANDTHGDDPTTIVSAGTHGDDWRCAVSEQFRNDSDDGTATPTGTT